MKKSLLALAVLGAFAGAASAQSSVTLFGIIDLSLNSVKNDGAGTRRSMDNNGINSNRLGFRGVEDLGGGLRAGFHLEGAMSNDTGNAYAPCTITPPATSCTPSGGQTWQRRSTVSLMGGFGELRLGRDYTPSFWNTTIFDPFGTNGVGSSLNITHNVGQITYVRSNNSVGYFLPALGGFYGQVMVAPGEGAAGKYSGGRIGFAAGPVNVAVSTGSQDTIPGGSTKFKHNSIGGSYKIGPATLMAQWNDEKSDTPAGDKETRILVGAAITMGQGEVRVAYTKTDEKDAANRDATQIALGYVYNLSPRTALYGTYASISNKAGSAFSVAAGGSTPGGPTAAGKSTGLQAGLRHSF